MLAIFNRDISQQQKIVSQFSKEYFKNEALSFQIILKLKTSIFPISN